MSDTKQPLAVFLHSGEYDRMHQGLSIAAAGVAAGRPVHVFFFWWALDRLVKDALDEPEFGREDVESRFEARAAPTLRQLLGHIKALGGCTLYACTGSLGLIGPGEEVASKVDRLVGWSTILQLTAGIVDRFYL